MRRTGKFSDHYEGPYIISRQLGDVNYALNKPGQDINMVVHINRLKPFKQPETIKTTEELIIYPEQSIKSKSGNTETTTPFKIINQFLKQQRRLPTCMNIFTYIDFLQKNKLPSTQAN